MSKVSRTNDSPYKNTVHIFIRSTLYQFWILGRCRTDKLERRMLDEIQRMFVEADSFYYSNGYNLSNCLQKNYEISHSESKCALPLWRNAEETFFWNQNMLNDLILSNVNILIKNLSITNIHFVFNTTTYF